MDQISLLVIGVIAFATFRPILVLPRIRLAPGFSFQKPIQFKFTL